MAHPTASSIFFFFLIVGFTLYITYLASKRTQTASDFYAAGRSVSALQNGFALAGDYMSAASFLGIAGMCALSGYDGMIYAAGWLVGWPALLFLVAEPVRNLGKFTFADVVSFRLRQRPVRLASAVAGSFTVLFYTIAQMVGSGHLVRLLFGVPYEAAEVLVGGVMIAYVLFGGMLATTWVQVVKTVLLLAGTTVLALLVLAKFEWDPANLYGEVARQYGQAALEPGGFVTSPLEAVSLGLALMLGLPGLPHVVMRLFTVPGAREARVSVLCATGLLGYFYCIIPIVGFGAAVLVKGAGLDGAALSGRAVIAGIDEGGNMAVPLLAELLGGPPFLGFMAAVAFATMLAVVAGLTLAGASVFSHDLYVSVVRGGVATEQEQVRAGRIATALFGVAAVLLGLLFQGQNVAFLVGLAFAVACSANFPALLLSILWKRFTTQGAVASIFVGAGLSVGMIVASPTVWVEVFGNAEALLDLRNPAVVSMPAAFAAGWLVSLATRDPRAEEGFEDEKLRTYLGVGAE